MDLTCPKCHEPMRTYERNGVHVDQCTGCRGIFLDRGELERLVDAEDRWNATTPGAGPQPVHPPQPPQPAYGQPTQPAQPVSSGSLSGMVGEVLQQVKAQQGGQRYPQGDRDGYRGGYKDGYKPRKKQSFLGELFG